MKNKRKWIGVILAGIMLCSMGVNAAAAGQTRNEIKSRGNLYFNNKTEDIAADDVIICAEDLLQTADRMDVLTEVCR